MKLIATTMLALGLLLGGIAASHAADDVPACCKKSCSTECAKCCKSGGCKKDCCSDKCCKGGSCGTPGKSCCGK